MSSCHHHNHTAEAEDPRDATPHQHHHPPLYYGHGYPAPCCPGTPSSCGHGYYPPYGFPNHPGCRRARTTFSNNQVIILEEEYEKDRYMDTFARVDLARRLNLNELQIKIWLQNRRAKDKREGRFGEEECYPATRNRRPTERIRTSLNSSPSDRSSNQENQGHHPHVGLEKKPAIVHSPYADVRNSPFHSNANIAERTSPSKKKSADDHKIFQPNYPMNGVIENGRSTFHSLSAYNVDELGALCAQWASDNNKK